MKIFILIIFLKDLKKLTDMLVTTPFFKNRNNTAWHTEYLEASPSLGSCHEARQSGQSSPEAADAPRTQILSFATNKKPPGFMFRSANLMFFKIT